MPDTSPVSRVRDTIYGLICTYLQAGNKDIAANFAGLTRDPKTGHRIFTVDGKNFYISARPTNGLFVTPGVNIYFGDTIAIKKKDLPQWYHMPVMIHVLCPYADEPLVGEKQALRISELVQNCFEGSGGLQQVYDFTTSPPTPVVSRFVSWVKVPRGTWKELGDPTTEDFTNRQWTTEVYYVR